MEIRGGKYKEDKENLKRYITMIDKTNKML